MNSTIKPKPCKTCQSLYHSAMWHKPRKAIETKTPLKSFIPPNPASKRQRLKAIKKHGKVAIKWRLVKDDWFTINPATKYRCHYCGLWMNQDQTTLDHLIPRSRAPQLRYVPSNLVPCCFKCNMMKGSVTHDEYSHVCHI